MAAWTDQRLETTISVLLRTGVMISAAIVLLGGICYLSRHGQEQPDYHVFKGAPEEYRSFGAAVHAAGMSNCSAIIQIGLLLLILTPVARVGFSLLGFALEGDRTYIVLTSLVLVILICSLAGSR